METQNIADSQELPVELSDAAWNSILPFLRDCRNVYVGTPEKCRHFLSAVLWITKEGATWRALPKVYGNWNAIYRRFSRWCDAGGRRTGWKLTTLEKNRRADISD